MMLFYKKIDNDRNLVTESKDYIIDKQMQNIVDYCQRTDVDSTAKYTKETPSIKPDLTIKSVNYSMNDFLKRTKDLKSKNESFMDESILKFNKNLENELRTKQSTLLNEEKQNAIENMGFHNENNFTTKKENFFSTDGMIELQDKLAGSYNYNDFNFHVSDGWMCEKCSNINRPDKAECMSMDY